MEVETKLMSTLSLCMALGCGQWVTHGTRLQVHYEHFAFALNNEMVI